MEKQVLNKQLNLKVPKGLKRKLIFKKMGFIIFGFVIFTIPALIGFLMYKNYPFTDHIYLKGDLQESKAVILDFKKGNHGRNCSDDGRDCEYIWVYFYEFTTETGEKYQWQSYSFNPNHKVGDLLKVQYNMQYPQYSKLAGFDNYHFGLTGLFIIAAICLFGFSLVITPFYKASLKIKLLKTGYTTKGTFVKKLERRDSEYDRLIGYELIFTYKDIKGKSRRKYLDVNLKDAEKLTDELEEWLVYGRDDPYNVILIDELPLKIAEDLKKQIKKHE